VEDILDHSFGDRFGAMETPVGGGIISNQDLVRYLDDRPGVRAFSSHQIRYPVPQAPGYLFFDICFLRDPLDRLRSFYDYFRQKPNPADPMSDLANQCGLGDFVAGMIADHSLFIRNNQVNLLACGGDSDEPNESDLDLATRRILETSFLGVVDCFGQSVAAGDDALRCAFPELDCARPAVNVSGGMRGTVAERTAALREACRPDVYEELMWITELDRRLVERARAEVLRRFDLVRPPTVRPTVAQEPGSRRLLNLVRYWRLKRNPLFDRRFYLDRNPDVLRAGVKPLLHYLRNGAAEDRKPHSLFDPVYYRTACRRSGIQPPQPGENPLLHFLDCGAAAANPHPLFDCEAYLNAHPNVADAGMNPLVHYVNTAASPVVTAGVEIMDVRLAAQVSQDERGLTQWIAEPQQLPFLRGARADQIRTQDESSSR
jgi:hypothetical protein